MFTCVIRLANFRVISVLPVIEVHPKSQAVDADDTVILDCYSSRAETTLWAKSGSNVDLKASNRINLLPNGSLEIKQFSAEDNGDYLCSAINPTGDSQSGPHYVGLIRKL